MENTPGNQINHISRTKLNLKQRLMVLFGATVVVEAHIVVDKDVVVVSYHLFESVTFKP